MGNSSGLGTTTIALYLVKISGFDALLGALGAILIVLGIVKNLLDIRYHPNLKSRKRYEQAKRKSDNAGGSNEL